MNNGLTFTRWTEAPLLIIDTVALLSINTRGDMWCSKLALSAPKWPKKATSLGLKQKTDDHFLTINKFHEKTKSYHELSL